MSFLQAVTDFLESIYTGLEEIVNWLISMTDYVETVNMTITATITKYLGLYRYLVGDTIYTAEVMIMYVTLLVTAIKVIGMFVSYWKKYNILSN
jgi:hypothetical protein